LKEVEKAKEQQESKLTKQQHIEEKKLKEVAILINNKRHLEVVA